MFIALSCLRNQDCPYQRIIKFGQQIWARFSRMPNCWLRHHLPEFYYSWQSTSDSPKNVPCLNSWGPELSQALSIVHLACKTAVLLHSQPEWRFVRNSTRAGREGWLFLQAIVDYPSPPPSNIIFKRSHQGS